MRKINVRIEVVMFPNFNKDSNLLEHEKISNMNLTQEPLHKERHMQWCYLTLIG